MLPLLDKPSIAFIIEEFLASGIYEILIITSRRKKVLEDYLDREIELESIFQAEGAEEKLKKIKPYKAKIYFVRQQEMLGTGHALLQAKSLLEGQPFVVAYPDDLHFGATPLTKQLIDTYRVTDCSVLATLHDPPEINRYGVLKIASDNLHVKDIVEKPAPGKEPSREASIGRYLYSYELFKLLEDGWDLHRGGEYYHTYALKQLMMQGKVVYKRTHGERLDTGTPEGYLRAILRYAGERPEMRKVISEEMKHLKSLQH